MNTKNKKNEKPFMEYEKPVMEIEEIEDVVLTSCDILTPEIEL